MEVHDNNNKKRRRKINIKQLPLYTSIGVLCGLVAFGGFISVIAVSAAYKGTLGLLAGLIGVLVLGISIFGLAMTFKGVREDDNMFFTMPLIAFTLNGAMALLFFILYIRGLIL